MMHCISELCNLAGIGRASFYRNFESKEDILQRYINKIFKEWTNVGNEAKNKNLFIRVIEKDNTIIGQNAKRCGLSISEYLRQRALGYMTRAVLPKIFFSFHDKLDELCVAAEGKITTDTEEKKITLIDGITAELILPQKKADVGKREQNRRYHKQDNISTFLAYTLL